MLFVAAQKMPNNREEGKVWTLVMAEKFTAV